MGSIGNAVSANARGIGRHCHYALSWVRSEGTSTKTDGFDEEMVLRNCVVDGEPEMIPTAVGIERVNLIEQIGIVAIAILAMLMDPIVQVFVKAIPHLQDRLSNALENFADFRAHFRHHYYAGHCTTPN